jgi:hypothetical protein
MEYAPRRKKQSVRRQLLILQFTNIHPFFSKKEIAELLGISHKEVQDTLNSEFIIIASKMNNKRT